MGLLFDSVSKYLPADVGDLFGILDRVVKGYDGIYATTGYAISKLPTTDVPTRPDLFELNPNATYAPGFLESMGVKPSDLPANKKPVFDHNGDFVGVKEIAAGPRCFGPDTLVQIPGGKSRRIADLKLNDTVLAFSSATGALEPARITQTHITPDQAVINFHDTIVTPGHVYLCPDDEFRQLGAILNADGYVVNSAGETVRARTGEVVSAESFALRQAMFGASGVPAFEVGFGVAADAEKPVQTAPQIGAVAGATGLADAQISGFLESFTYDTQLGLATNGLAA